MKDALGPAIKEQLGSVLKEHFDSGAIKRPHEEAEIDQQILAKASEFVVDFQHKQQKSPKDATGFRMQAFRGFQLAAQATSYFIQAGDKAKAMEWVGKIKLRAEIGMEVTLQLASEPRVGLTAADHSFNNIIGNIGTSTKPDEVEKADSLVHKQRDWALKSASATMPNSHTGGLSRSSGGSVSGSGDGGSHGGSLRGGGQRSGYDHGGHDSDRYDRGSSTKRDNCNGK